MGNTIELKSKGYDTIYEYIEKKRKEGHLLLIWSAEKPKKIRNKVSTLSIIGADIDTIKIYKDNHGNKFASITITVKGESKAYDMITLLLLGEAILSTLGLRIIARGGLLEHSLTSGTSKFHGLYQVRGKLREESEGIGGKSEYYDEEMNYYNERRERLRRESWYR